MDTVRSLTITFEEGTKQVVTPVDGTFVATYDPKLHVARVVPNLGQGTQVSCEPLPLSETPPGGMVDVSGYLALSCQGSVQRSGLPIPPFGMPKG